MKLILVSEDGRPLDVAVENVEEFNLTHPAAREKLITAISESASRAVFGGATTLDHEDRYRRSPPPDQSAAPAAIKARRGREFLIAIIHVDYDQTDGAVSYRRCTVELYRHGLHEHSSVFDSGSVCADFAAASFFAHTVVGESGAGHVMLSSDCDQFVCDAADYYWVEGKLGAMIAHRPTGGDDERAT